MNKFKSLILRIRASTEVDTRSLAIYRIFLGLWFIHTLRLETWLNDVPPTFFYPPFLSLANLFDRFPSRGFFFILNGASFVLAAMFTVGFRTRFAALGLLVAQVVFYSFHFSLGKINHSILLPATLFVMSYSACSEYISVDGWLRRRQVSVVFERTHLALLGVLIAWGFFTAGFGKALVWLDFNTDTSGFLAWLNNQYYNANRTLLLASWAVHMPWPRLWEIADITAVIFELGFFWALLSRQRWLFWLTIWCGFHLFNTLILNISFTINAIVMMAFVPWASLFNWRGPRLRIAQVGISLLCLGLIMKMTAGYINVQALETRLSLSTGEWALLGSAVLWLGLMFVFLQQCLFPTRLITEVSSVYRGAGPKD